MGAVRRYIHLNPITAGLTQDLPRYPWTSHKDYLKAKNRGAWLYTTQGLSFLSEKTSQVPEIYRRFMKEGPLNAAGTRPEVRFEAINFG